MFPRVGVQLLSGDDEEMASSATLAIEPTTVTMVAPGRVLSVDVLRGLTMALMILVNNPGDWSQIFSQLDHAEWNGWTLTDLVFPTFLFVMGVSMFFSLSSRAERGNCWKTRSGHIILRSLKIFGLGLLLSFFPRMHWTHLRIYGVLTRIAWCYLLAGLLLVATRRAKVIVGVIVVLLVGYWLALRFIAVPGGGAPVRDVPLLDPVWNVTAWIDRGFVAWMQKWLHTGRLYKKTSDPEGLLSTLPAVATTLLGVLAGMWMRLPIGWRRVRRGLVVAGVAGVVAGTIWAQWLPINKNLWTSSYVLLAAGWTSLALAACSWWVDGREGEWPRWLKAITWPWLVFGSNAIAAFTISTVIVEWMLFFRVSDASGDKHSLWEIYYDSVFARGGSNHWTSLAFAIAFVAVCFVPVWFLWRKKIFLRL